MPAYMVNEYYVFTSYEDMSSLIHDIIHYSLLPSQQDQYSFSILIGNLDINTLQFQSSTGQTIAVRYEQDNDIYYSV
ncbi:hypothetical protein SporoP37_09785 [Sporosarcina sp. P37]|uniref:hypothetical protein n=1 Tax=unclassified Sporosarcina TaxID=2647733 RepID=UPI000A17BCFC|nr:MULTISPECIES: hypothetical protein [unclassified Sporosarcina]ARK24924.1 hypothetical protein SporoP37_09785 [Sporosarcina sp. P37]PID18065.1 hypothetical protein CSV62_09995 [Sporosarcina sp. P35]